MIFPNKNTDPNLSIINSMYFVLELLMSSGAATVREVREYVELNISDDALPLVEPSIDLLFLLGKVQYNADIDSLYFILEQSRRKTA